MYSNQANSRQNTIVIPVIWNSVNMFNLKCPPKNKSYILKVSFSHKPYQLGKHSFQNNELQS